ncbi:hypothetical protein P167DRAFT_543398 [Morchella conica CCBAS932]|uniref:Uncharacterized protein n=1 Tax=Morchella conica CCBAS932 TaxID=1392247 RepID=A0A3N4KWZ7_9PEZI|nr:hypothetical protein P167DRAFT_543398 [Morchella conica CCBAS932]
MNTTTSSSPPALSEDMKCSRNLKSKKRSASIKRKIIGTKAEKRHRPVAVLKINLAGKSKNSAFGPTKNPHGNARITKRRASKVKENQNFISLIRLPNAQDPAIFETMNYADDEDPAPVDIDIILENEPVEIIYPTSIVTHTEKEQVNLELAAKVACARIASTPVFRNSPSPASRSSYKNPRKVLSHRREPKHATPQHQVTTAKKAKKASPKGKKMTKRASLKAKATAARIIEYAKVKFSNSIVKKIVPIEDPETLIDNKTTSAMSEMMGRLTLKSANLRSRVSNGIRTWFSPLRNLPVTPLEEIL